MRLDTFDDLQAEFSRVEELRQAGRYTDALDGYLAIIEARLEKLIGGGEPAELSAADLVILERMADVAALLGHHEVADDLLAAMVDQLEQVENYVGADYASLKRIHLALGCGHLRDADALLRDMRSRIGEIDDIVFSRPGLARWESEREWPGANADERALLFSRLYHMMGWLLADLGQYESALCALEQGLKHASVDAHPLARRASLPLRLAAAGALLEKGDLREARARLAALHSELDEHVNPGWYIRCLELQGKCSMLCGDYGDAHSRFKRIWVICSSRRFERPALTAALNLAHALILLNHTGVAKQLLSATIKRGQRLGETPAVSRAFFLIQLADARSHPLSGGNHLADRVAGQPRRAAETSVEPEGLPLSDPLNIPQSDNYLAFFEDRALGFQWHLGLGNTELASQVYSEMEQTFAATDSVLIRQRLRVMEGFLAYFKDDLISAERILSESRAMLSELGLIPELWQAQRVLIWCWKRLGSPPELRRELEGDNSALLSRMTESLPADHRAVFLLNKWTSDEEYIAGEIDYLRALKEKVINGPRITRPLRRWEMMKQLFALLKHIDRYKDALAKRQHGGTEVEEEQASGQSLWHRLWQHPRKRATISFLVLPDRLLVVRAGWLSLDFEVLKVSRLKVRELARQWHTLVGRASTGRGDDTMEDASTSKTGSNYLDSLLGVWRDFSLAAGQASIPDRCMKILREMSETLGIASLLDILPRRIHALTLIPDDSLHGFPFAALIHAGKFLVERYAITLAFESESSRSSDDESLDKQALIVGVATGHGKMFSPLPGVRLEVKHLKEWLSEFGMPASTLEDEEATKSALLEHLPSATLLHMACHGIFKPDSPDGSGLVLIPSSERMEILTLRELSALNLSRLRHVSLSSCWSADNFVLPGRWVISLPETLWRAGAQSVLGHLWKVDDSSAVPFIKRFYENAASHNMDEALRLTQLACLQKNLIPDPYGFDTSSPMHWAGYNLYGNYEYLRI
jgi:hypothetical protein